MLILIQMSGRPGFGKSTIAREIGRQLPAVILDYDVTKTALLDQGVSFDDAGRLAYESGYAIARSILAQGISVILDSPCRFDRILTAGLTIAKSTEACYRYVECVLNDTAEVQRRIQARTRVRSQVVDLGVPSPDARHDPNSGIGASTAPADATVRPLEGYLQVDTTAPIEECVQVVLRYVTGDLRVVPHSKHLPSD